MKIDRLLIVAGPSCSGKTRLISSIQDGESVLVSKQFECFGEIGGWPLIGTTRLRHSSETEFDNLILHCDMTAEHRNNRFKFIQAVIKSANDASVVTLCTEPKELRKRLFRRICSFCRDLPRQRGADRHLTRQRIYYSTRNLVGYSFRRNAQKIYQDWFSLISKNQSLNKNYLFDSNTLSSTELIDVSAANYERLVAKVLF